MNFWACLWCFEMFAPHLFTVPVVKATWEKDAEFLEFYSDVTDASIPTVTLGVANTERGDHGLSTFLLSHSNRVTTIEPKALGLHSNVSHKALWHHLEPHSVLSKCFYSLLTENESSVTARTDSPTNFRLLTLPNELQWTAGLSHVKLHFHMVFTSMIVF